MPSHGLDLLTFYGTNTARVLSIITLVLVFASSIVVIVDDVNAVRRGSDMPSGTVTDASGEEFDLDCDYVDGSTVPVQPAGMFFAIMNHLFIIAQCIILVLSEIGWPQSFFENFIPVLGPNHGVGILGAMQVFLGAAVLSHHVPTFALVSAFFLFAIGCLNILLGLIFRSSIKKLRAEMTPSPNDDENYNSNYHIDARKRHSFHPTIGNAEKGEKNGDLPPYQGGLGYSEMTEEKASLKGHGTAKPQAAAQKYRQRPLLLTTRLSGRNSPDSMRGAEKNLDGSAV